MPWKETQVMEERLKFIAAYLEGEWTMSELCRAYGVSRPTGYEVIARYQAHGLDGVRDRSRAAQHHPNQMAPALAEQVVQARHAHPRWGRANCGSGWRGNSLTCRGRPRDRHAAHVPRLGGAAPPGPPHPRSGRPRGAGHALSVEMGASNIGCVGDCRNDGAVTINDLVTGVGIILGNRSLTACSLFDLNGDGQLVISELVRAVRNALEGCFDATVELPNLLTTTDVVFDSWGIPHIFGPDRESVIFMQGYETAKVRFWQMDGFRRLVEGRLSELFGELTLETDIEMRTLFTTRDGRRLEEALWERLQQEAPEVAELIRAYADGVNAWLADLRAGPNGVMLPPEYSLFLVNLGPDELDDWRPQDTVAIARLQQFNLSFGLDGEIAAAESLAALPDALWRDVFRSAPAMTATILPADGASDAGRPVARASLQSAQLPPLSVLRSVSAMFNRGAAFSPLAPHQAGSNNWAVSPSLSDTGYAMLANDPHLPLLNPMI